MKNGGDALHETAARGVEAIHMIVEQRDRLLTDSERMKTDILLLREKNAQLESRLAHATVERDHYMRYCTELTSKLNDIQMLILNCVEAAKHAAYRPQVGVVAPSQQDAALDIDAKAVEALIKRLPQNGGEPN
jgi:hypothetical protein